MSNIDKEKFLESVGMLEGLDNKEQISDILNVLNKDVLESGEEEDVVNYYRSRRDEYVNYLEDMDKKKIKEMLVMLFRIKDDSIVEQLEGKDIKNNYEDKIMELFRENNVISRYYDIEDIVTYVRYIRFVNSFPIQKEEKESMLKDRKEMIKNSIDDLINDFTDIYVLKEYTEDE